MTLRDWAVNTAHDARQQGVWTALQRGAAQLAVGAGRRVGRRATYGTHVWDREWDVLVLLDSCRHDLMAEVAPTVDWLPDDVPSIYSRASMSAEWLIRHTQPEYRQEMEETALITANAYSREDYVDPADWQHIDEVWRDHWDGDAGTVRPRPVTDAAIRYWRKPDREAGRMIVWYLQPHQPFLDADWSNPFVSTAFGEGAKGDQKGVWQQLRDGDVTEAELWRAYRANLEHALADVGRLVENVDGRVVISSDHGNCLGEWGVYGHPRNAPLPSLKRVPWIELDATDRQTATPGEADQTATAADVSTDEKLRALGYLD